jgi:hypothetical protein
MVVRASGASETKVKKSIVKIAYFDGYVVCIAYQVVVIFVLQMPTFKLENKNLK